MIHMLKNVLVYTLLVIRDMASWRSVRSVGRELTLGISCWYLQLN